MEFIIINDSDKATYMDLLLIADEQVSMIEKYLYRGEMFALKDDDVKALCVVTAYSAERVRLNRLSWARIPRPFSSSSA